MLHYLSLMEENNTPFVSFDNARVALYKTTESSCAPSNNDDPKPDPGSVFLQVQERRVKEQQVEEIQSLLGALPPK